MGEIKIFEHADFGQVRILDRAGEPWLVAKDVADVLGYDQTSNMLKRLDEDEKDKIKSSILDDLNQSNDLAIINESGLYNAIIGSRKPEAKRFKKWVTSEVLPDIRKHGFYGTDSFLDRMINDPDNLVLAIQQCKFEREQRQLAERQRDEAIRRQAQIGSRREATSMNTASQFAKQNERLRIQVGDATNWKTVKGINWLKEEFAFSKPMYQAVGKRLSALSKRMDYEKKTVEDMEHGTIGAYHVDVIEALRLELKIDLNLLSKYRKR